MKITKEFLLDVPMRDWDQKLTGITGVYLIPTDEPYDDYLTVCIMRMVATKRVGDTTEFTGVGYSCDDVMLKGSHFRIDCVDGITHIWNSYGSFTVTEDLSTIDFIEER